MTLWQDIMHYAFGERLLIPFTASSYYSGSGQVLNRQGLLSMLEPETTLGPWIVIVLLLGYVLILGPIRLLVIKRLQKPKTWGWRIIVSSIIIFSLLSYLLAYYQRGASLTTNTISVLQMNQGGSSAHITTYMGIYVPDQGNYNVQVPTKGLIEPITQPPLANRSAGTPLSEVETHFTSEKSSTAMNMQQRSPWTFHPAVLEQDRQLSGNLKSNLTLEGNKLKGTLQNTLNTVLSDVYVLLPRSFVRIGDISPGETKRIDLLLQNVSPGLSLADEIAQQGGLQTPYFPYSQQQRPQSSFQRHMALLSAMSGTGSVLPFCKINSCILSTFTDREKIIVPNGQVPNRQMISRRDPLLLTDNAATLIAWADQDLVGANQITVNGRPPQGRHESFLQMPLVPHFANPGSLPFNYITGQVVDIQSYNAEISQPGIYSLLKDSSDSGLTFGFTLPDTLNTFGHKLRITVPDLLTTPVTDNGQASNLPSHIRGYLYNWLTGKWDSISFQQSSVTASPTSYLSAGNQVLLYLTYGESYKGKLFFGKPGLTLEG
jgi:hypothetical protein